MWSIWPEEALGPYWLEVPHAAYEEIVEVATIVVVVVEVVVDREMRRVVYVEVVENERVEETSGGTWKNIRS